MTDNAGSSHEQPGNGPAPTAAQELPRSVPSFVCVLPCTKQVVKYLDRLEGCVTGIHVTCEETKDIHVLYRRMAEAILAKEAQPVGEASPDPCAVCKAPIVPNSTSPMIFMENCAHYFHYCCFKGVPISKSGHFQVDCPGVPSSRVLFWPQVFPTASAKNEHFQLQKRSLGLDVAPQTVLKVNNCYVEGELPIVPVFDLFINGKYLTVRKRPPQNSVSGRSSVREGGRYCGSWRRDVKVNETYLVQVLQRLKSVLPRTFYLGEILPLEENVPLQEGLEPPLGEYTKRHKLLFQFRCPFARLDGPIGPNGEQCSEGLRCEFWHGWPTNTPKFIVERVKIRDFPTYLCLKNSRTLYGPKCIELIRVHSEELFRCSAGFHPSTKDLQNMKRFAHKMAKLIMAPVVVPEQYPFCAFCREPAKPNSLLMHMQNCVHWLHAHCLPLARRVNSIRKLEFECPTCQAPSMRTIAWPGLFRSDLVKQTIFDRQLAEFKLTVQADTQLAITEVANRVNVFTLDHGGTSVVTIDCATAQNNSTIMYD